MWLVPDGMRQQAFGGIRSEDYPGQWGQANGNSEKICFVKNNQINY